MIAVNRGLPSDWCKRVFVEHPSFDFLGLKSASNIFLHHLKLAEENTFKQKFQIVVDSDLDGICSAAIIYKFLNKFYPNVETVYSIHNGKQHGLSKDIKIDNDTTLVILPDAGSNDIYQCRDLRNKYKEVICLDHHIIEEINPYANVVNCMDGHYSNQNLCGAAVTWLFLWGFCHNCVSFFDEHKSYLLDMTDLVATATISDIMDVTNEDNMYFIQNGLDNIKSNVLKSFLLANEVDLTDVTIEDIKFKVAPLVSAMIRMGNMPEKELLFRAFIDDYEEFDYEKRGSLDIDIENIYDRVVRLCKNAKSRQDRAKQKLLEECTVHEYPYILLVEYESDKSSTLTGLVANELTNQYCKPCIVYRKVNQNSEDSDGYLEYSGSIRNYDGSPISDFKYILGLAFGNNCDVQGHANAAGFKFKDINPDDFASRFTQALFSSEHENEEDIPDVAIGERLYNVDFQIDADSLDAGFVQKMHLFEHYSGYGFATATALVTGIKVSSENFRTMGKNTFNWKIYDEDTGVTYVKFKVDKENDELVNKFDNCDLGATYYDDVGYVINAICTFGLNIYKGEIHCQCIVKDYEIVDLFTKEVDDFDDFDFDL